MEKSNKTLNLQQEIVREIMVMDFEVKDVSIRNMVEQIVAHTLARAELYFVNSETKDLAKEIGKLEIDINKARAQATAEMLKEVEEKFVNHVRTKTDLLDELICKNQKQIGFPLHLHMHQLCKDLWKVSADDWKQLLRTQSGAGGK